MAGSIVNLEASRGAAEMSSHNLLLWRDTIVQAGTTVQLPNGVNILAGLISRETGAQLKYCLPPPKGILGDNGNAAGPCQIDKHSYPDLFAGWVAGKYTTLDGIRQGAMILNEKVKTIKRLMPTIPINSALFVQCVIASYNCGEGNVRTAIKAGLTPDIYTANGSYATDVLTRAEYFKSKNYFAVSTVGVAVLHSVMT